jgi:hypothetical protein
VQDLTDDTQTLDLDAALERTMARHGELVHQRNMRRRWITGGACAVVLIAAAVIIPQLSSGNGQRVQVADGGNAAATTSTVDTPGFRMTKDGDVTVLTRQADTPVTTVPVNGEVGVGEASRASRPAPVVSVAAGSSRDSVLVGFTGCGFAIESVRYRQSTEGLVVDAAVEDTHCPANETEVTVELPLDSPWVPGTPVVVAPL